MAWTSKLLGVFKRVNTGLAESGASLLHALTSVPIGQSHNKVL